MGTRWNRDERGLTILGLGVLVAGVLVVVAVVSVGLGARRSVGDESAKRDAKAAGLAASMHAAETGEVPTAAELEAYEPSLDYETLDPGEEAEVQGKVYVRTHGNVAEVVSRFGDTCYWAQKTPAAPTRYAEGPCEADPSTLVFHEGNGW